MAVRMCDCDLLSQIREFIAKKEKRDTDKDQAFLEAWDGHEQNKSEYFECRVRLSKQSLAAAELGVDQAEDFQWRLWKEMHETVLVELDLFHSQRTVQGTVLSMVTEPLLERINLLHQMQMERTTNRCNILLSSLTQLRPLLTVVKNSADTLKLNHLVMEAALSTHKRLEHEALLRTEREATFKSFLSSTATKHHNGAWHFQCLEAQGFDPNNLTSTVGVILSSEYSSEVLLTADAFAALHGDLDTVCYLISRGAGFQAKTKCNKSPAYFASLGGHLDVLELIVEVAGDSSVQISEVWDSSPLVAAIIGQHVETAKWLCRKGSKVQYEYIGMVATDTLLSCASRGESSTKAYELVKWLLTEFNLSNEISIRWPPQVDVENPANWIIRIMSGGARNTSPVVNAIQCSNFAVFGLLVMEHGAWDSIDGKIDYEVARSDLSDISFQHRQELAEFLREHINKRQLEFDTFLVGTVANVSSSPLCHLSSVVDPDTATGLLMKIAEFTGLPFGISLAKLRSVIEAIESVLTFSDDESLDDY